MGEGNSQLIARLKGLVDGVGDDWVIVDVNGVGYRAFCSGRTLSNMPGQGQMVSLQIETHIREDHFHLYGFIDQSELDWFKLLTTVQGVGAKVCLAILSALGPEQLVQAIAAQDKAAVTRANGVGPKLATRIVSELKDKVGAFSLGGAALSDVATNISSTTPTTSGASDDAISALVNLGYSRSDAFTAVVKAKGVLGDDADVSALIRAGLQELSR